MNNTDPLLLYIALARTYSTESRVMIEVEEIRKFIDVRRDLMNRTRIDYLDQN